MKSQLDKPNKQNKPEKPARTTRPLLGITMGDPAGIGPEVIAKALAGTSVAATVSSDCHWLVAGDAADGQESQAQDERDSRGGSRS